MGVTEKKEKEPSFELSLQSNSKGNARLEFIRTEWNGLVDYVYQKEDGTYHSASMYLESYQKGTQKWKSYQKQKLYLEGTESIVLRLAPLKGEKILWPEDGLKSAEIYRSEDEKNFSLWDTAEYLEYGGIKYANYYTGKYKVWLADNQENQQEKQFIIGIYSCSRGNSTLSLKGGNCTTKDYKIGSNDGSFSLWIKEYSKDNFVQTDIAQIEIEGDVEKSYVYQDEEISMYYELESGKLSSILLASE